MNQRIEPIIQLMPEALRPLLEQELLKEKPYIEELHFRVGAPIELYGDGRAWCVSDNGKLITADSSLLAHIIEAAAEHSLYAAQEQLCQGFLTICGGHRVGVCGTAVMKQDAVSTLKDFSALNIRIAREIPGCADRVVNALWSHPASTLLVGAPGAGKTTILRDLIRQMSDRLQYQISLADERGEVAACCGGAAQFHVGRRTNVLSGCSKEQSIYMLLRSMRPQWIALDEISAEQDVLAIERASYCGVRFLATAHAWSPQELQKRPLYRRLLQSGVFENLAFIEKDRSICCQRV